MRNSTWRSLKLEAGETLAGLELDEPTVAISDLLEAPVSLDRLHLRIFVGHGLLVALLDGRDFEADGGMECSGQVTLPSVLWLGDYVEFVSPHVVDGTDRETVVIRDDEDVLVEAVSIQRSHNVGVRAYGVELKGPGCRYVDKSSKSVVSHGGGAVRIGGSIRQVVWCWLHLWWAGHG